MQKVYKHKHRLFKIDDSSHPNIKITLNGTKRYGYVGVIPLSDGIYTWTKFDSESTEEGIITNIVHHKRRHTKLKNAVNELCRELIEDNQYDEELILRAEHRQTARQKITEFMDKL